MNDIMIDLPFAEKELIGEHAEATIHVHILTIFLAEKKVNP